jgi:hypothetical protein
MIWEKCRQFIGSVREKITLYCDFNIIKQTQAIVVKAP